MKLFGCCWAIEGGGPRLWEAEAGPKKSRDRGREPRGGPPCQFCRSVDRDNTTERPPRLRLRSDWDEKRAQRYCARSLHRYTHTGPRGVAKLAACEAAGSAPARKCRLFRAGPQRARFRDGWLFGMMTDLHGTRMPHLLA